ncbi:LADA_0H16798g1_1 [Lachancea dasiensis]|uniref:N-acetyltransferase ECO1 n=1 Tax=Lachancea dasiensis TaxID=1072105 RepID=A0A1G4K5C8_9SACH|nr:LADA_0H16798g1_1 [Lachancea dasiensis]
MIRAGKSKQSTPKRKALGQSRLIFGKQREAKPFQCLECSLSYSPSVIQDIAAHAKHHDLHLCGKRWSPKWGEVVQSFSRSIPVKHRRNNNDCGPVTGAKEICTGAGTDQIVQISKTRSSEVKATLEIMHIVNEELQAPHDENHFWIGDSGINNNTQRRSLKSSDGSAFAYIRGGRAVGIITVEILNEVDERGRWMICDSAHVVPGVRPPVKLGISRIWVCKKERGGHIATRLLEAARHHTISGLEIAKWEMAWSQPSESGGKLAKSYNSVNHPKSGNVLIPCYI